MPGSDSRNLTRAEQSYVAQVTYQLRHLPRQQQHHLLQTLRRRLLWLAPYDGYGRIEKEMGTPAEYAQGLLQGAPSEPATASSGKRRFWGARTRGGAA